MRKFGVFTSFILISAIVAGIYGIIHDQITYTISPEYFTKFKFKQFKVSPAQFGGNRQAVAIIGFLATWWMGILIGLTIGLTSFIFRDHVQMKNMLKKSVKIILFITILAAVIGFVASKLSLITITISWGADELNDRRNFLHVAAIHNSSYIGGIAGVLAGVFYLIIKKKALHQNESTIHYPK
jgi:MFS family permease